MEPKLSSKTSVPCSELLCAIKRWEEETAPLRNRSVLTEPAEPVELLEQGNGALRRDLRGCPHRLGEHLRQAPQPLCQRLIQLKKRENTDKGSE